MAGPFQTRGNNAANLSPVNVSGGFSKPQVADSTLQNIENINKNVQVIAEVNNQRLESEAVTNIQQEIKSVRDALQISRQGSGAEVFTSEALQDPYVQSVFKEFNEIQNAAWQGVFPQDMALERMDTLLSEAVNRRPQFADAIRQAANTTAGANISAKFFDQLISQTPEQQTAERLRGEAAYYGIDESTYRGIVGQQFQREMVINQIEFDKAQGTVTLGQLRNQANNMVFDLTDNIQGLMRAKLREGGIQNPEEYKQFVGQQMSIIRQQVLGNLPPSVASSDINSVVSALDAHEERLFRQIDNGSMLQVAGGQVELFKLRTQQNALTAAPDMMMIFDIYGKERGEVIWNNIKKAKDNPEGYAKIYGSLEGGTLNFVDSLVQQAYTSGQILNGEKQATTEQEKRHAGITAAQELQAGQTNAGGEVVLTPTRAVNLVSAVQDMGFDYGIVALSDAKVAQTLKGYKETHDQLISVYKRAESSLQYEYNQLKARGFLNDGDITVKNGKLFVDYADGVVNLEAGERAQRSSAIETFIQNANLTLKMGQQYQSKGVFPTTVFQSTNGLLDSIVKQEIEARPAEGGSNEDGVIRFDLDANGNIVPVE